MKEWYIFYNDLLLLRRDSDGNFSIPRGETIPLTPDTYQHLHRVQINDGREVFALSIPEPIKDTTHKWEMRNLRSTYECLPQSDYAAAGKAYQILWWDKHSHFCPACGNTMVQHTPIMKKCASCNYEMYPAVSTAIIVLITRGNEILLVRNRQWKTSFHGLVAGFLEAGETLEECVRREVQEETGLMVKNIRYFRSQPWPYPSGLMVGFIAEYESGEIKLQEEELSHAAFYTIDTLPPLPQKLSIARQLIDNWIESQFHEKEERL